MVFLRLIRELAMTYQAFERFSFSHIQGLGMTPTQFDVIVTLGNQPPMTCKELGEKSLITKGTMTGVLQRLEEKGWVGRSVHPYDARSVQISLTESGDTLFRQIFPEHLKYLAQAFSELSETELEQLIENFRDLRVRLNAHTR